jgi:hypothetical protein
MNTLQLAYAVLKAAQIREESYDRKAADDAVRKRDAEYKGGVQYPCPIDFSKFYTKTLEQSVEESVSLTKLPPKLSYIIWLLLYTAWNDAISWAEEVITRRD